MTSHKFIVGHLVDFRPGPLDRNVTPGTYRIERLLPIEGGDRQYRVKHAVDGHERVIEERQLESSRSNLNNAFAGFGR